MTVVIAVGVAQIILTGIFLIRTKRIKEVGNLPKMMITLANISFLAQIAREIYQLIASNETTTIFVTTTFQVLINLPLVLNITIWLRFRRVQVQLRASKENTNDIISSIVAVPLKIVVIEKHFKLHESDKSPDSFFSIVPTQLKKLKKYTLSIHKSILKKNKSKDVSNKILRRSIFSTVDINKNEKLTKKNIDTFRPRVGIPAEYYFDVLGKKTKSKIEKFQPIFLRNLK